MPQQPFLAPGPAVVSNKPAVLPNNAMAWNNDGNGIVAVSGTHRPACFGVAYGDRYILVGTGLPIGDLPQGLPYLLSESGTFGSKV